MTRRFHPLFAGLAAAALTALPAARAAAQGNEGQQPPELQQPPTQRGTQAPPSTPQQFGEQQNPTHKGTQASPSTSPREGTLTAPMRLNESTSFPVENGCHYQADVKGVVVPTKAAAARPGTEQGEQKLNSNVTVTATLTCPNEAQQKVSETVTKAGMTRQELLDTLELRGSIMSASTGQRCVYMPNFDFTDENRLAAKGVSFMCPLHGQGATKGIP